MLAFSYFVINMDDSLTSKSNLNPKSISCNVCKKSFKSKHSLIVHKRTHLPYTKPYTCNVCDKSFG